MKLFTLALLATALVVAAAVPASAHYRAVGKHCRDVKFTPQSDDVASAIHKRQISCKRARRIVTIVRRQGDLTPQGWSCKHRVHDPSNGLGHTDFLCTNTGGRRLSWAQY